MVLSVGDGETSLWCMILAWDDGAAFSCSVDRTVNRDDLQPIRVMHWSAVVTELKFLMYCMG